MRRLKSSLVRARAAILAALLAATPLAADAQPPSNVVTAWAAIVQQAIHNAGAPRSAGTSQVLQAMMQLAMYDAAVGVEGGYKPYASGIARRAEADIRAAVATAAYRASRGRVLASQFGFLDQKYAEYLATIPDGAAKTDGVELGEEVAAAILALRSDDNFGITVLYQCSAVPPPIREFEPDNGCPMDPTPAQPVDTKVGFIKPFTLRRASQFRPGKPTALTSRRYAIDFAETRDYGRADSTLRTAEQTDVAYFWSENPYVFWNRNLIALAQQRALDVQDTARFLAMTHTAVADAIIAGFEAKYHYSLWRPRTAIPHADDDGNPRTNGDPTWTPLLKVNHPEFPSGHGFWSTALTDAIAAFFETDQVPVTLVVLRANVPQVVVSERSYADLKVLMEEVTNARIWGGLHWRHSMDAGARLGRRVAARVTEKYFTPVK